MHFSLSDERKGHVGQLDQVSAGAYAAVTRDERADAPVDEFYQELNHLRMNARFPLQESTYAGNHGGPYGSISERLSGTGGMAADNIVLEFFQMVVIHAPLGHGAKAGVDTVNDFVFVELLKELVATLYLCHGGRIQVKRFSVEYYILGLG
jgi:hypothetical protein